MDPTGHRHRAVGVISFVVATLLPGLAAADTLVSGYAEIGLGGGPLVGDLADEFEGGAQMRFAGGLRLGRVAIGLGTTMGLASPVAVERHGISDRGYFGVGPELSVFFGGPTRLRPYVRVGTQRRWYGGDRVTRRCADYSVCDAGFWLDTGGYGATSNTGAIGAEYLFDEPSRKNTLIAVSLELSVEHTRVLVVDEHVDGAMVGLTLSFRVGGGRIAPKGGHQ